MYRLRSLLDDRDLFSVERHETVFAVASKMADLKVGAILVLSPEGALEGLFSERDLMTRVVVAGLDPRHTPVARVMTTDLATIDESESSEAAMETMHRCGCRHLPVMRGSKVAGMISMRDLMNLELEEKTQELQHMRAYIHGAA